MLANALLGAVAMLLLSIRILLRMIHEYTVLVRIVVQTLEFCQPFLMERLWIQILKELGMEPFNQYGTPRNQPPTLLIHRALNRWILFKHKLHVHSDLTSRKITADANTTCYFHHCTIIFIRFKCSPTAVYNP